jgi:NitT/TauT family transport system substrate-binding protein
MGIVHLMEDENYNITVVGSPDDLVGKIVTGELDIAAVPSNMAAILYQRTGQKIQLLAINTLGVLYILENGEGVHSVTDLAGETLHVSGKGATPDFVIQYLLREHGLEAGKDVVLDFSTQHADLAAVMAAGKQRLALLPQPHVTSVLMQNKDVRVALDITREWKNVTGGELPMGVIIGQKEFIENNESSLLTFLEKYEQSIRLVNQNVTEAAELIAKHDILPNAKVAEQAIPLSNIVYIDAVTGKSYLNDFFSILYQFSPESIGGKMPDEGLYYYR